MKLTAAQRCALAWLSVQDWSDSWWGGKPMCGYPSQMREPTFSFLAKNKLIRAKSGKWSETIYTLTDEGREALASDGGRER